MPTPSMDSIQSARAVSQEIHKLGLSIRSVADRTGIDYGSLRAKIAGERDFSIGELARLADHLRVPPYTFTPERFIPAESLVKAA